MVTYFQIQMSAIRTLEKRTKKNVDIFFGLFSIRLCHFTHSTVIIISIMVIKMDDNKSYIALCYGFHKSAATKVYAMFIMILI